MSNIPSGCGVGGAVDVLWCRVVPTTARANLFRAAREITQQHFIIIKNIMLRLRTIARTSTRALSTTTISERVTVTRQADGIARVTLTRPKKMNALDIDMFKAIQEAARSLIADSAGVRAVVLHGEGRAFCAGLDVRSVMHPMSAKRNMDELLHRPEGEAGNLAQDVGYLWRRVPVPVIAATHGVALGGGLQIALGADMRISTPSCKFSVMEAKWGLIPDMSATVTLPELVPRDVALELTLTGRVFLADEALRLGLVTRLEEEPLEAAMALATEISKKSPDAVSAAKRLMHATYAAGCDDQRALRVESELQKRLIGGWNQAVCVAKGLGAPPFLQPGFKERQAEWDKEADEETEAELQAILDGVGVDLKPPSEVRLTPKRATAA